MSLSPSSAPTVFPCPSCGRDFALPPLAQESTGACPHCAVLLSFPAVIPWPDPIILPEPPQPVDLSGESQRRKLRVRTPFMPGSRASNPTPSKEPPRWPKPGDPATPAAAPSNQNQSPPPTNPHPSHSPSSPSIPSIPSIPSSPSGLMSGSTPFPTPPPVMAGATTENPVKIPPHSRPSPCAAPIALPSAPSRLNQETTTITPESGDSLYNSTKNSTASAPPPATAVWQPSLPQKSAWRSRLKALLPLAGAAIVCSAALASWRIWPAAFYFTDTSDPSEELLLHYRPGDPEKQGKQAPRLKQTHPAPPRVASPFNEFASEGFDFKAPVDYWERIGAAESPFALLRPSFTLHRSEASPPSDFGLGACDFSLTTELLPDGPGIEDTWPSIPAVLALQSHFSCGIPQHYEVTLPGPPSLRFLRLVWDAPAAAPTAPPQRLEMWIHQQGRIAWCMTGIMPGNSAAYALTRTMQRLTGGFSVLEIAPEVLLASLQDRDLQGASPLPSLPSPQPLHRWKSLPPNTTTWPGGRFSAPGADSVWASADSRIAIVSLPLQGLQNIPPSRLLTALRQIWPLLRSVSIPATETESPLPGKSLDLSMPATYEGKPALCALRLHPSPQGTVIAVALQLQPPPSLQNPDSAPPPAPQIPSPGPTSAATPGLTTQLSPLALLDLLELGPPSGQPAPSGLVCILELPLLHALANEALADGRLDEAATLEKAVFLRSQRIEDLAQACTALANAGKIEESTRFFDTGGTRFSNAPGWDLYRTLILARIGAGPRAHRQAMSLLADRKFPGSLAAPYLEALIDSQSWTEARAFASLLVRNDPDSVLWRLHYASILAQTGERPKALAIIQATWQTWPDDAMLGIECVQKLLHLQQYQDASALATRVAKHHPTHEQAQLLLGECLTFLGRTDDARLAYQQALKASPTSQSARNALTSLAATSAQADSSYVTASIDPVPLPTALLENPPIPSLSHSPPALILSQITGHRQQRGRLPATTVRAKILIANAEGMTQWNTLALPVDPSRERLALHYLNVLDPSGKTIIARGSPQDRYSLDTPDGSKKIHFPIPGLLPGCIIEYAVTTESLTPSQTWPFIRHPFALPVPCLSNTCYVTGDLPSLTWRHSLATQPLRSGDTLIWQEKNLQNTPSLQSPPPTLHLGSVTETWDTVAQRYLEQIRHRLTPSPSVQSLAHRLTKNLPTPAEKTAALARLVRADISYTEIEFGLRAIIPHDAATTLQNRFGDCKDHSVLLHSLLTAAGIPSFLALTHSEIPVHPDFPSLNQFDHMIVALPTSGGNHDFIDPTDKFLDPRPGTAPLGLAGHQALILDPANPRLVPIPTTLPPTEGTLLRTVTPQENLDLQITDRLTLNGPAAATLRAHLSPLPPASHLPLLNRLLGPDRLRTQLLDLQTANLRDPSQPLTLTLTWLARQTTRPSPDGLEIELPSPLADHLILSRIPDILPAGHPFTLDSALHLRITTTLIPRPGQTLHPPEPSKSPPSPLGSWETASTANSFTLNISLNPGTWSGPDADTAALLPAKALAPLRAPRILTTRTLVSTP